MAGKPDLVTVTEEMASLMESALWGETTWPQILSGFADLIPDTKIHSVHHSPLNGQALTLHWHGYSDTVANDYKNHFINIDPWAPVLAQQPDGTVFVSEQQMPAHLLKNTEYYDGLLRNFGDHQAWCGLKLDVIKGENVFLGLRYPLMVKNELDSFYFHLLTQLKTSLSQVVRADKKNIILEQKNTARGAMLTTRRPAFIVNNTMKLLEVSSSGEEMLKQRRLVRIQNGILHFSHRDLEQQVQACTTALSATPVSPVQHVVWTWGDHRWVIDFTRISSNDGKPLLHSPALILITVSDLTKKTVTLSEPILKSLFELTGTEARLCNALVNTLSLSEAAKMTGISYEHARQRIRIIFSKTQTDSQTTLCALLARLIH
ncbi:TPA: hypothetical protein OTT35_000043 [Citrobacter koseri]|nr:hypothetical protein [Citrobacter koseri]